jgi:hypothetical protein
VVGLVRGEFEVESEKIKENFASEGSVSSQMNARSFDKLKII